MMKGKRVVSILSLAIIVALGACGYWGWTQVQSLRGREALAATGLQFLSLDEALTLARTQGRTVLVDFSAIWCPTCRVLHREVFTDAGVQRAIAARYVLARMDFDAPQAAAFMQHYGVTGFPSLLVLDPEGKLLRVVPVSLEPKTLAAALDGPNG